MRQVNLKILRACIFVDFLINDLFIGFAAD